MRFEIFPIALASVLTLTLMTGGLLYAQAEKGENPGKGNSAKAKVEAKGQATGNANAKAEVKVRGNAGKAKGNKDNKGIDISGQAAEKTRDIRDKALEKRDRAVEKARKASGKSVEKLEKAREAREKGLEKREDSLEKAREARRNGLRVSQEARQRVRIHVDNIDEFSENDLRDISEEMLDTERLIFIGDRTLDNADFLELFGMDMDEDAIVYFHLEPEDRDFLIDLYNARRSDEGFLAPVSRTLPYPFGIRKNLALGKPLPPGLINRADLLPMEVQTRLGIPASDAYRVALLGDQLVLLDANRNLVLDMLRFSNGNVIAPDLYVDHPYLWETGFDQDDRVVVVNYLEANPEVYDLGFYEWLESRLLENIGLGQQFIIGEPVPEGLDIDYLPPTLYDEVGFDGRTNLLIGVYGDDIILLDANSNVVVDVMEDVV